MKPSSKNENIEEQKNWEENKKEEENRKKEMAHFKDQPQNEVGLTSGYFMRNARYKPGVKPLKMKEIDF